MLNKKYLLIIPLLLVTVLALFLFYKISFNEGPPNPFFTFNEPDAFYSIKNTNDLYWVVYKNPSRDNEYARGSEILVGKSEVELEPYLGKDLIINGSFRDSYGKAQCIINKCKDFTYNSLVIDIQNITERKH